MLVTDRIYASNAKTRNLVDLLMDQRKINGRSKTFPRNLIPKESRKRRNGSSFTKRNFMEKLAQGVLFTTRKDTMQKTARDKRIRSSFFNNCRSIQTSLIFLMWNRSIPSQKNKPLSHYLQYTSLTVKVTIHPAQMISSLQLLELTKSILLIAPSSPHSLSL